MHGACFGLAAAGPVTSTFCTAPSGPKVTVARDASGTSPRQARAAGRTCVMAFATALPEGRSGRVSGPVDAGARGPGGATAGGSAAAGAPAASRSADASALVGAGPRDGLGAAADAGGGLAADAGGGLAADAG